MFNAIDMQLNKWWVYAPQSTCAISNATFITITTIRIMFRARAKHYSTRVWYNNLFKQYSRMVWCNNLFRDRRLSKSCSRYRRDWVRGF